MDDSPAQQLPDPAHPNGDGAASSPPIVVPPVELVIRFHPLTQNVEVSGPVEERVLLYGMLEMARTMIDDMYLKADLEKGAPRVIPASGPLPPFPRRS